MNNDQSLHYSEHPEVVSLLKGQYAEGAYGTVFFVGELAIKIFRRNGGDFSSEKHIRRTFVNEVRAYQAALLHEDLRGYVSHFKGQAVMRQVLSICGEDVSADYFLDCAYVMDRLRGNAKKNEDLSYEEREKIERLFGLHGIRYTRDCSAFCDFNGRVQSVIDFGIECIEAVSCLY